MNFIFKTIFFSPLIHLCMNPSARQEWCRKNGVEFHYPQPQQQQPYYQQQQQYGVPVQVQPPTSYQNDGKGQYEQQPPPYQEV